MDQDESVEQENAVSQEEVLESPGTLEEPKGNPRPFSELPSLWRKIAQMDTAFFSSEMPRTSVSNTLLSVLLVAGITVILVGIGALVGLMVGGIRNAGFGNIAETSGSLATVVLSVACLEIILIPLSFYLNNGVIFVAALVLGGKGKFSSQAYLDSLFFVPLSIISGLIGLFSAVPIVGSCVVLVGVLGIIIYRTILQVRVIKAVHSFVTGRAVASVFAPMLLWILVVFCVGVPLIMAIVSSISRYSY